jgi:hypothetical protein
MMTGRIFLDIVTSRERRARGHRARDEPRPALPQKDEAMQHRAAARLNGLPALASFATPPSAARDIYACNVNNP